jgi:hypothetical protein
MSMSIGSVGAAQAAQSYSGAVAVTSLSQVKLKGQEAVDLLKSATTSSSGTGQLVNTYA